MYFNQEGITPLSTLKRGASIHVIGVAGIAMSQLAVKLKQIGFNVSGSDKEFYPPSGDLLKENNIQIFKGYSEGNISPDTDLVVIGNAVLRENPEVLQVEKLKLPYSILPKLLSDIVMTGEKRIVVCGTHGKTTTTAFFSKTLRDLGQDPSFMIGGLSSQLGESLYAGVGNISVVEGDEYDSSFFAKVPKFYFYRATDLVLTSLEFDHADIYNSLEDIVGVFTAYFERHPATRVYACVDGEAVRNNLEKWSKILKEKPVTYSANRESDADFKIIGTRVGNGRQTVSYINRGEEGEYKLKIPGKHNAANALSILSVLTSLGYKEKDIASKLENFEGVRRRQQVYEFSNEVTVIDDFAHHPTEVSATLNAVKEWYKGRRLIAAFEARSNTSRREIFFNQYKEALSSADLSFILSPVAREIDKGHALLDVRELSRSIGSSSQGFHDVNELASSLIGQLKRGDVICLMSNGSFGGLLETLRTRLSR